MTPRLVEDVRKNEYNQIDPQNIVSLRTKKLAKDGLTRVLFMLAFDEGKKGLRV